MQTDKVQRQDSPHALINRSNRQINESDAQQLHFKGIGLVFGLCLHDFTETDAEEKLLIFKPEKHGGLHE